MSITVDDNTIGLWYVDLPPGTNWLAELKKEGEKYKLTHRFRYSKSDDPWDEKDIKNWYEGLLTGTEVEVVDKMRSAVKALVEKGKGTPYELLRGKATTEQFIEEWASMPFCHKKVVKPQ